MKNLALLVSVLSLAACGPGSASGDCEGLLAGDLVITEVFADAKAPVGGSGTDDGKEWFEIYNNTDNPVELKGLKVTHSRPDDSRAKSHVMTAVTIAPGQFFTLGNSADDLLPAYIDYGFAADLGDFFNTDGGKLAISCGGAEVDSAIYEMVKEGRSRQLTSAQPPDYTLNDDGANWCEANATEFESANFGTPGSDNDCTPVVVGQCNEGGTMRPTMTPAVGDVVITEAIPNPAVVSDSDGEWFEIYAVKAIDLNGVGLDRAGDTANPKVLESADCIHMAAGSYGIFVKNSNMAVNGGLPSAAIKGEFSFSLVDGSVATPGDVRLMLGADVLDAITWTSSTDGASVQLDPDSLDSTSNDDPTNFCAATTSYSADNKGTPGAANTQCGGVQPAGTCMDPVSSTTRPIAKPAAGQLVITEFLANPAGTAAGVDGREEWFEIKNTGTTSFDLNGLGLKGSAATVNPIASTTCKPVAAGAYALFAHNTIETENGGLPVVDATFTFALGQTAGTVSVLDGTTAAAPVLDAVTWATVWDVNDGESKQLDSTTTTSTANDLPENWCAGLVAYSALSTNLGTPKAANTCP